MVSFWGIIMFYLQINIYMQEVSCSSDYIYYIGATVLHVGLSGNERVQETVVFL